MDTLSKQLSAKESTFVYELLQNANDYPIEGKLVDVEFHITDNYLLFMHTGDKFNVRNISGICGINEKRRSLTERLLVIKALASKPFFLITTTYISVRDNTLFDLTRRPLRLEDLKHLGQFCLFGLTTQRSHQK